MGKKWYFAVALLIIIAASIVLLVHQNKQTNTNSSQNSAQFIPQGTYFSKVRELSAGTKPACLTHDAVLDKIVQADQKLPFDTSMSVALGTVIPDMPAGYTTTYLHTYTPTSATGYEIFSDKNQQKFVGTLKSFNFSIQRSGVDAAWQLKSFIACSE